MADTEQGLADEREQRIDMLRPWLDRMPNPLDWPPDEHAAWKRVVQINNNITAAQRAADRVRVEALLDGPVADMLAEAKRQGAVEALRAMTQRTFTTANGRYGVDAALTAFAAHIDQGGPF